MSVRKGERASVAYDEICPQCDGIGYVQYADYLEDQACDVCRGSGRRDNPSLRLCTVCGRQMFGSRTMHWECEMRENENRATAYGGSDKQQNRGAPPEIMIGPTITDNGLFLWTGRCECGWSTRWGNQEGVEEAAQQHRSAHAPVPRIWDYDPYRIQEEP